MATSTELRLDVAILGGGFAGVYCARMLERRLGRGQGRSVGLIAAENFMVFQPMLAEVAGGSLSPRHVINPLRLLCGRTQILRGRVESINLAEKFLSLNAGDFSGNVNVRFNHLVLALGAIINLSRIPGMPEHALLMQNVGDAMHLRTTVINRLEEANLETRGEVRRRMTSFVIVGGGYSGVETAAQVLDLLDAVRHFYPKLSRDGFEVYLVHAEDHLLPTVRRRLGEYAARDLAKRGLKIILCRRVSTVTASRVCLEDGSCIETHTVVSTVGNGPHPLVVRLCQENGIRAEKGRIITANTGAVDGRPGLWACGDCAAFPVVTGGWCPQTGQFAMRQGALVGRNVASAMAGQPARAFNYKGVGELASLGHRRAVAEIMGFAFSGFFAWWLWRTIYLLKLPRLDRKVRVMLDWTLDLFFPRDLNVLNPRYSTVLKEIYLAAGDVLFQAGERAFSFYIVKSGHIEIFDDHGVMQVAGSGDYFGEGALLADKTWHYGARATEPTRLVSIPDHVFQQMIGGAGSLGRLFRKSAGRFTSRDMIASLTGRLPESARRKTAADLMSRNVCVLHPDTTVREALAIMKETPHGCYPLVAENKALDGAVMREDFYDFLKQPGTAGETRLDHFPTATLPSVGLDCPVEEMIERLVRSGASKLLVVDGGKKLAGIITMMDLVTEVQAARATDPA